MTLSITHIVEEEFLPTLQCCTAFLRSHRSTSCGLSSGLWAVAASQFFSLSSFLLEIFCCAWHHYCVAEHNVGHLIFHFKILWYTVHDGLNDRTAPCDWNHRPSRTVFTGGTSCLLCLVFTKMVVFNIAKLLNFGLFCPKAAAPDVLWFVQWQLCKPEPSCRSLFRAGRGLIIQSSSDCTVVNFKTSTLKVVLTLSEDQTIKCICLATPGCCSPS